MYVWRVIVFTDVIAGGLDLSLGAWRCGLVAKSVHGCLMKWSAADAMAKLSPFLSWTHSHTEVLYILG